MPLETEIAALTAAVKENSDLLRQCLTASTTLPANVTPIAPAAAPAPATTGEVELPEKIERKGPGRPKKEAPAAPVDDTPSIPAANPDPSGPVAGEHVDVDEIIARINEVVKGKVVAAAETGEDEEVKNAWAAVRAKYGVARISELKDQPAKLLAALKDAEAL